MKKCMLCFLVFLLVGSAWALPVIENPSFEVDGDAPVGPGTYKPTGWIIQGTAGINPVNPAFEDANTFILIGGRNPFANNGKVPDGEYVAYLQATTLNNAKTAISQVITNGFEPGKTYVLQFYENARSTYGGPSTSIVRLGSHVLMNWHDTTAVDTLNQHENPYHRRITAEFTTNTTLPNITTPLPILLQISMSGRATKINGQLPNYPEGTPPEVRDQWRTASTLLLDNFKFIELGDLKLLPNARRSYTNKSMVTVKFSKDISEESATNRINYIITNPTTRVISAKRGADDKTVILTTDEIPDNFTFPTLRVEGVLDKDGKGMFRNVSQTQIDIAAYNPVDFTGTVNGFEDDFNAASRDSNWMPHPEDHDVYDQQFGILKVRSAKGTGNHLLYEAPDYDGVRQEILARMRIVQGPEGTVAGLTASTVADASSGFDYGLIHESGEKKAKLTQLAGGSTAPTAATWELNTWYWVRLKHDVDGEGKGIAMARFWLADQNTPEPETWASVQESSTAASGFAGILGGINEVQSEVEFDYILIKAAGLPEITPQLPSARPLFLEVSRNGETVELRWPVLGSEGASLEANSVLDSSSYWFNPDQTLLENDGTYYKLPITPTEPMLFYRLRR